MLLATCYEKTVLNEEKKSYETALVRAPQGVSDVSGVDHRLIRWVFVFVSFFRAVQKGDHSKGKAWNVK